MFFLQATNADMGAKLAIQKCLGQIDGMEARALSTYATNTKHWLINTQNQLDNGVDEPEEYECQQ